MPTRKATAQWKGTLTKGEGQLGVESGAFEGAYSFGSRFENAPGTNPEELLGAAHAGCFSMALSLLVEKAGFTPKRIHTTADVTVDKVGDGFKITTIALDTEADIPDMSNDAFREQAEAAKNNCPVSQALAGVEISLSARLAG